MNNDSTDGSLQPSHPISDDVVERARKTSIFSTLLDYMPWRARRASLEDSVAELIEEHDPQGVHIDEESRMWLHNVLELSDSAVDSIKVPRSDIIAVPDSIVLEDLKKIVIEHEHTRMPVYHDTLDNVLGFVHIKDLIRYIGTDKPFDINAIIHKALFIAPSMKIADLLAKMRVSRVHMAIILDEFGGTDGLVTLEDLMEEIVGEINDEHDELEEEELQVLTESSLEASARLDIEKLEARLSTVLHDEAEDDFDTVGGLVVSLSGHVPEQGEIVVHEPSGIVFEVLEADPRRVKRVRVDYGEMDSSGI